MSRPLTFLERWDRRRAGPEPSTTKSTRGSDPRQDNEEIRGLLNAGHRRGAKAGRCVIKGKTVKTEEIEADRAVALAGLGGLPDTILTRSILIPMRRRSSAETVQPYRRRVHAAEGLTLGKQLAAWAECAEATLTHAWPAMPDSVQDRDADVWEPLLAVADMAGGDWPERARVAAVSLVAQSRDSTSEPRHPLLADLKTVFGDHEALSTETILNRLKELPESPWTDIRGKPLTDRGLATRLRGYEVKPKTIRMGKGTLRGYTQTDLWDAWQRYLPQSGPEAKQAQQAKQEA